MPWCLCGCSGKHNLSMAKTKAALVLLILCFLLMHQLGLNPVEGLKEEAKIDCGGRCAYRCSQASRKKICVRACHSCCRRCNCVPPGTSGNHGMCPCYAAITTHGGRLKCP